ncbi:MAG: GWxTD domain-containing protein [Candidatus Zixiibacteriota bacterium]|nr:MAG: GWxTD domain-containing protein [candidate division Zixibacteria bacterium]
MKHAFLLIIMISLAAPALLAQPEYYADPFLGFPEFRVLPLRLPTTHPDSVDLEVHVRILHDDLQFVKSDGGYRAGYGLDVYLEDRSGRILGSDHLDREVNVATYTQTNSRQSGEQTRSVFRLAPQRSNLRITLVDRESRKDRTLEKEIVFSDKEWNRNLRLGDLSLVDSTGQVQMASGLLSGQSLAASLVLYSQNTEGNSLEYQLLDEGDQVVAGGSVELGEPANFYADTLSLPTAGLANGAYRLVVLARNGEDRLARGYPFRVLWQNLPDYIRDLDLAIRQLKYIANDEEMERLQRAPRSQKAEAFHQFWKKRDATPNTAVNERMEEYYRRIRYASEQFSGFREGWESDMGRVYVIFGPPTDIERHPFDIDRKPYEVWYYYDINRRFYFVDEEGFGEYRLTSPLWHEY